MRGDPTLTAGIFKHAHKLRRHFLGGVSVVISGRVEMTESGGGLVLCFSLEHQQAPAARQTERQASYSATTDTT